MSRVLNASSAGNLWRDAGNKPSDCRSDNRFGSVRAWLCNMGRGGIVSFSRRAIFRMPPKICQINN